MVTVHQWDEETLLKAVKGSPHDVLDRCSHYADNGEALLMGEDQRDAIELENLRMAGSGLRVLGFAYSKDVDGDLRGQEGDPPGYIWAGLVGLEDPLREEARPLIRALHRAGIRTVVITGDQSSTAQHIGNELELSGAAPLRILDSADLQSLDAAGTRSIATQAHVFARLNPTQKLQVVQAYQSAGMSVAMVGDGLNDVLALRVADVGIAMGKDGSVLARRSADLVLEDDDLQSVMLAIATGRGFYRNMHRSVRFLLTAHHMDLFMDVSEKGLGIGSGPGMTQALWNNLMCLSLALDPPCLGTADEGPIPHEESLLQAHDVEETFVDAARLLGSAAIPASYGALRYGAGQEAARLFSQSASMNQILYGTACRRRNGASPGALPSNPLLDLTLTGTVGSLFMGALLPAMGKSVGQAASRLLDVLVLGATGFFCLGILKDNGANDRDPTVAAPPEAGLRAE
jgi:Ca2+-transporting ATPase